MPVQQDSEVAPALYRTFNGLSGPVHSDLTVNTEGKYGGVFQNAEMAIVRTRVMNRITMADGTIVEKEGWILLNVLMSDVLAHSDRFDDPHGSLAAHLQKSRLADTDELPLADTAESPLAKTAESPLDDSAVSAPVALGNGSFGLVVSPLTYPAQDDTLHGAPLFRALRSLSSEFGDQELANRAGSLATWLGTLLPVTSDGGFGLPITTSKGSYEVFIEAVSFGPPENGHPAATGTKLYDRENEYGDHNEGNVTATTRSFNIGGSYTADSQAEFPDPDPNFFLAPGVEGSITHSMRGEQALLRGGNVLAMKGVRANESHDFEQSVTYHVQIRPLGLNLTGPKSLKVIQAHTMTVPTGGVRPKDSDPTTYDFTLRQGLPSEYRILGAKGLKAIFGTVLGTKGVFGTKPAASKLVDEPISATPPGSTG